MEYLSRDFLSSQNAQHILPQEPSSLPEKVLQFGTGVLLRGLPDLLINEANRQGIFNSRIVVVKSTSSGDTAEFDQQDNLYTVCIRGVQDGARVEQNMVCSAISRVLTANTQWDEILACAKNPALEIVISNTTEVGIKLVKEDIHQTPPASFPGKLLAFLYARYQAFTGDPTKGLIITPTELIPDNGDKLERILLELAHLNNLEADFIDWMEQHNHCCNTLVDRIVPGKPAAETKTNIETQLGYRDDLLIMSEVYALWAIEGDEFVKNRFPLHLAHQGVIIAPDINPYRELKLRILNGGHTFSCGLAYLCGLDTVVEGMNHALFAHFIERLLLDEIAQTIPQPLTQAEAQTFAKKVLDRFRNPFIEHKWLSITMQYSSKMQMRNVPTILRYYDALGIVPEHMAFGFAAYLLFLRVVKTEEGRFYGQRNGVDYLIQDDQAAYFYTMWQNFSTRALVSAVLKNEDLWGTDLSRLNGFEEKVAFHLEAMKDRGVSRTLENFSHIAQAAQS